MASDSPSVSRAAVVPGLTPETFAFYRGLLADPTKAYWTAHRGQYEQHVRAPLQHLLETLAADVGGEPVVFRPYRDVRFSADTSPYKTAQGAFLAVAPGVGYYAEVSADGLSLGGGFHPQDRAQTRRFRSAVDDQAAGPELARIVRTLRRKGFQIGGRQVATRPRGVPADHPRLDLIRREYVTVARGLPPEPLAAAPLRRVTADAWAEVRPLVEWLLRHAHPEPA